MSAEFHIRISNLRAGKHGDASLHSEANNERYGRSIKTEEFISNLSRNHHYGVFFGPQLNSVSRRGRTDSLFEPPPGVRYRVVRLVRHRFVHYLLDRGMGITLGLRWFYTIRPTPAGRKGSHAHVTGSGPTQGRLTS